MIVDKWVSFAVAISICLEVTGETSKCWVKELVPEGYVPQVAPLATKVGSKHQHWHATSYL